MTIKHLFKLVPIILVLISDAAIAQELGRADHALNTVIAQFVIDVTTDASSDMYQFIRAMMVGLAFIGVAWHVIQWAMKSIDLGELAIYFLTCFLIFAFYFSYNSAVSEFWSWSDAIALGVQEQAVGTRDPIFIGSKLNEAMMNFFLKDVSIFDGFSAVFSIVAFRLISGLLSIVIFIISQWSVWGYAFAKITGLLFLPLLFLPLTRGFFDKWFQILLGFWFFNLFAKITLTLYHLYFFAIFGVINEPVEFDPIGDTLALQKINLHFLIGIIFLISSGGLASVMASGFGGITSRASGTASKLAALATKFFTKI